ncbi:unnamed protein product [Spodoptera exigua]|nr:unnamed protein product [Spodoptera exigua]
MDLTTRRGDMLEGAGDVLSLNGNGTDQVCRDLVNGTESGCDVNTVTAEVTSRKTNSFSIRNLVGTGEPDRPSDGAPNPSDDLNSKWWVMEMPKSNSGRDQCDDGDDNDNGRMSLDIDPSGPHLCYPNGSLLAVLRIIAVDLTLRIIHSIGQQGNRETNDGKRSVPTMDIHAPCH